MVYHDPKIENQEPAEVFSPLRQLFYEAAEEQSRIEMAKAFLAAGLLRRQKVFRLIKESDESDGEVRITLYTDRIGNRLIEVPDPQFTYAEMDKARTLLIERLQVLEQAAAPPPATAEVEAPAATNPLDEDSPESSEMPDSATTTPENEGEPLDSSAEDEEDEFDDDDDDDDEDEFDDEDDEDEFDDDDDEDDDEEDEFDDDDDDDDEFDDEDDEDEDGDEDLDEAADDEDREVKVMESALAGSGSTRGYAAGYVAFANEEALHAQA
ncbi:MAG: hypothetical protein JNK74_11275 [Candidatus Hydrogenedentes bacterium]|nr:hypothetical protein [Candidatus Hydrogenedentota bacterium]